MSGPRGGSAARAPVGPPADPSGGAPTRAAAHRLAAAWAGRAAAADRAGALPAADVADLRLSGLLRAALPTAHGGTDLALREAVELQSIVAGGSASSALVAAMTTMLVGHARDTDAWADERDRLFGLVADGALVNAVASERDLGSPSRGGLPVTELVPDGRGYRLRGHKLWATGGAHLTHLLVLARSGEAPVQVWVENHVPGVRWERSWGEGLSLRASDSHDVLFDDVAIEPDAVARMRPGPRIRNVWFTLLVAATYLGSAAAARDALIAFGRARVPSALGHPLSDLPEFRRGVGRLQVALHGAVATLRDAAEAWDRRREGWPAEIAKHLAVDAATTVTEGALRMAGGQALSRELPLERHFRDVRAGYGHPPSEADVFERVGDALLRDDPAAPPA